MPGADKYTIKGKRKKEQQSFLERHEIEKSTSGGIFSFREQMMGCCSNDVTILRKCALKFREDFIILTELDPFKSVTLAAACQKYFETFVLKKEEIGTISTQSCKPNRKTSIEATQWLEWENMSVCKRIQHRRAKKKVKIGRYFVDGVDEQTKTVYEFNECVFHGHPDCTEEDDLVPFGNLTMKKAYKEWEERKEYLQSRGYQVEVKRSCEWIDEPRDPDIHHFLQSVNLQDPPCPRDGVFGGRTNAFRLYH